MTSSVAERVRQIVAELPHLDDVTGLWTEIEARLGQGDAAFLSDLGVALTARYGAERPWQYGSVFDRLLRLLALTPGPGHVGHALRLVSVMDRPKAARYAASLLASGQEARDLAAAFSGRAPEELRACLVHELVLRGVAVEEVPAIARWATSPHWRHHPLGWLPLSRSDVEEHAGLPSYSAGGTGYSTPYGPAGRPAGGVATARPAPGVVETTTEARSTLMASAVANWVDESNGRAEARTFASDAPVDADPATFLALGLECLDGAKVLSVSPCPPAHAWRVLFAAASSGGAYNSGDHGAYGRLAAWQSMAGLSGAGDGAAAEEVEARVRECAWYAFDAATSWFEQVAWDIGLAATTPDGRGLAVLAATDTD